MQGSADVHALGCKIAGMTSIMTEIGVVEKHAQAAQETLNACFESMHEAEQKLNAACYFKKELYDDKAWQERNGVSIEDCFEVMFLTCLHVCTHAVIYEIGWGFRETS